MYCHLFKDCTFYGNLGEVQRCHSDLFLWQMVSDSLSLEFSENSKKFSEKQFQISKNFSTHTCTIYYMHYYK